jgi:hypothetical protein
MERMTTSTFLRTLLAGLCLVAFTACDALDDRLQEENTSPTAANEIDPDFQFANVLLNMSGDRFETWRANLIYSSVAVQHNATLVGYWAGDKYFKIESYTGAFWNRRYGSPVRNLTDLIASTEGDPEQVNRNLMARATRVLLFHRMTDLYGDVPYSEAGKGFTESVLQPKYDAQEAIYEDMVGELKAVRDSLDPSKPTFGDGDLFFGGDVQKWRRFANSLMLRIALRHVKAAPDKAEQWAQDALNSDAGVMQSNDDIAFINHAGGPNGINRNGNGQVFDFISPAPPYLSQRFVDWMTDRDDPRMRVYGEEDGDPPVGLPNGYDDSGQNPIQEHPSYIECEVSPGEEGGPQPDPCGTDVYTRPNEVLLGLDDPMFFQTYAEVELMRAEAIERGYVSGDSEQAFRDGVRAALEYLSMYGSEADIPESEVDAYVDARGSAYAGASRADRIRMINEQYWAATYMNHYESFANWRRSGYPDLEKSPVDMEGSYPGSATAGDFIRRLTYPVSEASQNTENYEAALERQGINNVLDARVWWDREGSGRFIGDDG